ncbi:MAG: hypothetical protein HYW24_01740 [Candidatus Aenigmarchaeota archaeon]|nr:hypothetical protein [Candidatus Aenigmarchaeota archaeon]
MTKKLRIVLATSSYPSAMYFVESVCREKNVAGIIFEEKRGRKESILRVLKRTRKLGLLKAIDELIFYFSKRFLLGKGKAFSKTNDAYIDNIPICYVKNINDTEAKNFIRKLKADVLVVYGVSILKDEIISILPKGVLNMHPGITPEYRGLDPLFWSIINKDFDKIGATIHFIDKGVDTGPVIVQNTIDVRRNDSYATLFEKVLKEGINSMIAALTLVENDAVKIINRQKSSSRLYTRPGISNYLAYRKGMKTLRESRNL